MPRRGLPPLFAFLAILSCPPASAADVELWSCTRADGSPIFANHTKGMTDCRPVPLQAELGYVKRTAEERIVPPAPLPPQPPPAVQPITINIIVSAAAPPPPPKTETEFAVGEIPFEVVRMLSVGMTEAEILRRAGPPQTTLIGGSYSFSAPYTSWPIFGANRFVYASGDWLVELAFSGGRVLSINQTRVRP